MTDTKASLTRRGLDSLVCTALNNRSVIEEMGGDCKEFHLRLVLHNGLSKCLEHCDLLRNSCRSIALSAYISPKRDEYYENTCVAYRSVVSYKQHTLNLHNDSRLSLGRFTLKRSFAFL